MKELKITPKLLSTFVIILMITMITWAIKEVIENKNKSTHIEQSYMENLLYTRAVFNNNTIWHKYDDIRLKTNDSIKLIRYKEAEMWIDKFEKIEKIGNNEN